MSWLRAILTCRDCSRQIVRDRIDERVRAQVRPRTPIQDRCDLCGVAVAEPVLVGVDGIIDAVTLRRRIRARLARARASLRDSSRDG